MVKQTRNPDHRTIIQLVRQWLQACLTTDLHLDLLINLWNEIRGLTTFQFSLVQPFAASIRALINLDGPRKAIGIELLAKCRLIEVEDIRIVISHTSISKDLADTLIKCIEAVQKIVKAELGSWRKKHTEKTSNSPKR